MISSDVGVRFSSRNRHINWPADCQLGCLTMFYSFALRYFFMIWFNWPEKTQLGRAPGSISTALFVSGLCLSPKNNGKADERQTMCVWPCLWLNCLRIFTCLAVPSWEEHRLFSSTEAGNRAQEVSIKIHCPRNSSTTKKSRSTVYLHRLIIV